MVALLVGMAVMAIMMSAAMPVWRTAAVREREAELIFRGNQYGRAIALFQRKYAGAFPPSIDVLVTEHFLRKKYKDPITGEDFQLVGPGTAIPGQGAPGQGAPGQGAAGRGAAPPGQRPGFTTTTPPTSSTSAGSTMTQAAAGIGGAPAGGIMGVASKSTAKSLRLFNGRDNNEWIFVGTQASTRAGTGATGTGRAGGVSGTGTPGGSRTGGAPGTTGPGGAGIRTSPGFPTPPRR